MDTQALVRALVERFGSEEALASRANVGQSSVNRWLHGGKIRSDNLTTLMELARDVPAASAALAGAAGGPDAFTPRIVPGGDLVGRRDFPVYAAAQGGDGHQIVTFDAIDYVKRPAVVEHVPDAYGLYIVGESMVPAFEPGDMALVNPRLPAARDKNAVFYHVPPTSGGDVEAIVKRLMSFSERDWHLRQWNPSRDFTEARADWPVCHRIVGKYEAR